MHTCDVYCIVLYIVAKPVPLFVIRFGFLLLFCPNREFDYLLYMFIIIQQQHIIFVYFFSFGFVSMEFYSFG